MEILTPLLLVLAALAALYSVTAASIERLLWGSLISSAGLGLAVQLHGGGYYGILMVAVFVVTDLMVYLFFRSLKLLPDREARNARGDRMFRIFFLWLSFCSLAGILLIAFLSDNEEIWRMPAVSAVDLLSGRIWGNDWFLVVLPMLGLVVLTTGGFFLVRRDP